MAPNFTRENSVETVQDAVRLTVYESRDGAGERLAPKAIAQGMNVPASILYDIADDTRDRKLRAEEVPSLVQTTNNFLVLDVLERAVGRVGVKLPQGDPVTLAQSSVVIKEFGQFLEELGKAAPHGYTRAEARKVRTEGEQVVALILGLVKEVESQAKAGRR